MRPNYFLSRGRHHTGELGRCSMEWVSYIAGEPHTDRPQCVSPLLRRFCMSLNDSLDDQERQKLRPYLARCVGTVGDGLDERRTWMCADWLIREFVPAQLDAAGCRASASSLRSLPPVVSADGARAAQHRLEVARSVVRASCHGATHALRVASVIANGEAYGDWPVRAAAAALYHSKGLSERATIRESLFNLLDRMLPTVPVELPADRQQIALELAG